MKKYASVLFLALIVSAMAIAQHKSSISIVPKPMEIKAGKGSFSLNASTLLLVDAGNKEIRQTAKLIVQKIALAGGPTLAIGDYAAGSIPKNSIILTLQGGDASLGREGYTLDVSRKNIIIRAVAGNGLFYATQSFFQLFPPEIELLSSFRHTYKLPVVSIRDMPRYPYRGMHLDVGRHLFPPEFIKSYIDLMAVYKMNNFHWHLTDDQGWRIEIRKYPKLTQLGSVRSGSQLGRSSESDGIPYGGFYTREQAREIVAYASARYVNVIPEIEMPGHSIAALTAYPSLSCTGGPFKVRSEWGVADDILCAGNDSSFIFVQDVLGEIMDIFPSEYIHIGGDEAPKTRWKSCPKCQARIRAEGLKDEMDLQSYFIRRVEKFLNSKGRKLIGWDEILEGGLPPEATVMSWRGIQGGIDAARQNHDVIMTPVDNCYFDYYQADPATEPLAIGGFLSLKTVYNYEPTPPVLNPEQARHILGAQGNLWTEYITSPQMVEYMAYPRAIALAEVNWSPKESRNWDDFIDRMDAQYKRLTYKGINFSKGSFQVDITTVRDSVNNRNLVQLSSETKGCDILYTTDGSEPTLHSAKYVRAFEIPGSCTVKACLAGNGEIKGSVNQREIVVNKASGKPVTLSKPYSFKYPATGKNAMTDGLIGTSSLKAGWQGYEGTDMDLVIDLLKPVSFSSISTSFIQDPGSWVIYPVEVSYFTSTDGINWTAAGQIKTEPQPSKGKADRQFGVSFPQTTARYIRVTAKNAGKLPDWHEYKGQPCWMFADEVVVE